MNIEVRCAHDELVPISELKPHPKNRNAHPEDQVERLAKIIEYQGIRSPIKVSKLSGYITAGHGRLAALKKLGLKEAPVDYQDYENEEQEYADIQADNAIALWAQLDLGGIEIDCSSLSQDFDLNLLGIKDFQPKEIEQLEPGCDEDEVPEDVEPKTKLGDIYQLGRHRLMCGDATAITDVERLMALEKPDMVYTDPPYGISVAKSSSVGRSKAFGTGTGSGKNIIKAGVYSPIIGDDTTDTAVDAFHLCESLKIHVMCFWGANYYASKLPDLKKWIVWYKETTGDFSDAELAWTNLEGCIQLFKHTWNGLIKESERGEKRVHPTQKPVALAEWCFNELSPDGRSVLDLFGGSGSTLIACEKTDRTCFMMELDPHYCDVIVARWEKYTSKKAELINGQT